MSTNDTESVEAIANWMSPTTVGLRLQLSRQWVKQLCVRGELRAVSTELGYLIDPASVEAYARERERTASAQTRKRMERRAASLSDSSTH